MRFVAIDVETANADMASICSIGVAAFENGALASEWYSLINPDDFFDPVNISIHRIAESDAIRRTLTLRNNPIVKRSRMIPSLSTPNNHRNCQ